MTHYATNNGSSSKQLTSLYIIAFETSVPDTIRKSLEISPHLLFAFRSNYTCHQSASDSSAHLHRDSESTTSPLSCVLLRYISVQDADRTILTLTKLHPAVIGVLQLERVATEPYVKKLQTSFGRSFVSTAGSGDHSMFTTAQQRAWFRDFINRYRRASQRMEP